MLLPLVLASASCAPRGQMPVEQRRECRRLRARAALAGVGGAVGVVVVAAAFVVVVAAGGNVGGGGGGGGESRRAERRARRDRRRSICRALPYEAPVAVRESAPPISSLGLAPDDAEVARQLGALGLASCFASPEGWVELDLAIDGASGRVTRFDVDRPTSDAERACLGARLAGLRFAPFADELRVAVKVDLGWIPPPPP